jgi:hypothetical protein
MKFRFWERTAIRPDVLSSRLRQSRHVLATAHGDELVLLDLKRERYFTLNDVGSRVWTLLGQGTMRDEIATVIRREYDVSHRERGDLVANDVARLLADLHAAGLIVADDPAPGGRP